MKKFSIFFVFFSVSNTSIMNSIIHSINEALNSRKEKKKKDECKQLLKQFYKGDINKNKDYLSLKNTLNDDCEILRHIKGDASLSDIISPKHLGTKSTKAKDYKKKGDVVLHKQRIRRRSSLSPSLNKSIKSENIKKTNMLVRAGGIEDLVNSDFRNTPTVRLNGSRKSS